MLKTIFKILLVIFIIGIIFVGVMWAMQPEGPAKDKENSVSSTDDKEIDKAKGEASKLLDKVKLPLTKKEDDEKEIKEKPNELSSKKNMDDSSKKAQHNEKNEKLVYKFPKELATDRLTYTLHIDAFLFKEFADQLIEDLKRKKYPAYGVSVWNNKRQLWHAVRIGRYLNYDTADKKLSEFNLKERRSARVINLGTLEFFPPKYLTTEKTDDKKSKNNSAPKKTTTENNNPKTEISSNAKT